MSAAAPVVPAAEALPRTGVGQNAPGWWGMVLFCTTEVALFGYFIVSYFYLRGAAVAFAAEGGKHSSLTLPVVMTVLLVSSSFVLRWGEKGIERGDNTRLMIALGVTIALGVGFLATQAWSTRTPITRRRRMRTGRCSSRSRACTALTWRWDC